ncbi:YoaK family protein [Primorskyibacter sp. 2E107]|uniref:YoaK family protein n=1 Tax=Primorskyibacter sp. 2E107 TaxID=3403458 RepID=UPI003AF5CA9E
MLIRDDDTRTPMIDLRLAGMLSLVAGALNAVGFEIAGLFSANMTGNISAMADDIANGRFGVALMFGLIFVVFVAGALTAGLAVEIGRQRGMRSIYALLVLGEGAVLMGVGGAGLLGWHLFDGLHVIFVLSFVLGLQNAVTTRISRARVRTTHVSGIATDMGLALAGLWAGKLERARRLAQLKLHGVTVTAFVVGGVLGATVLSGLGWLSFCLWGVVLIGVAGRELAAAQG